MPIQKTYWSPQLAISISCLGEMVIKSYEAHKRNAPEEEMHGIAEAQEVGVRGMLKITHMWTNELLLFCNCFNSKKESVDKYLLLTACLLFHLQVVSPVNPYRWSIPSLYEIVRRKQENYHEGYFRYREKMLGNLFCGFLGSGVTNAFIESSAVLKLSPLFLAPLLGGITSGLGRWRYRRTINPDWDGGQEGQGANKK